MKTHLITNDTYLSCSGQGVKLLKFKKIYDENLALANGLISVRRLENLPFSAYFLNLNSEVLMINETGMKVCGHDSKENAHGKTIADIATHETAYHVMTGHQKTIKTNKLNIIEENVLLKNDVQFTSLTFLKPWYDFKGKPAGVFGCSFLAGIDNLACNLLKLVELGLLNNGLAATNTLPLLPGIEIDGHYLTAREVNCLKLYIKGKSAKEIGLDLGLSYRTVEHYIENIKYKLKVSSKSELIAKCNPAE